MYILTEVSLFQHIIFFSSHTCGRETRGNSPEEKGTGVYGKREKRGRKGGEIGENDATLAIYCNLVKGQRRGSQQNRAGNGE